MHAAADADDYDDGHHGGNGNSGNHPDVERARAGADPQETMAAIVVADLKLQTPR